MQIKLADFQKDAIIQLLGAMTLKKRDIVLKSCTGSGKTIILTHFIDTYCREFHRKVFIWLTPGKGNLEEQSKEKMDRYIHGSRTKLLSDVLSEGFEENDACFINWEKLTKKGNHALKEGERLNLLERIEQAHREGLEFLAIVDESHQNDTIKAADILSYFKAEKIIRCSATPKDYRNAKLIEVAEADVIAEGLIKKVLIINENFAQSINVDNQIEYLIGNALQKQRVLRAEYLRRGRKINPLMIIQLPNKSKTLQSQVEQYLKTQGITYGNGQLAVWLSKQKENLKGIEALTSSVSAVIIKQAVATGWDCPRAQILVKLRDNMNETFEIQTIGRIRRMPEAHHYENDLLDSCYLYTLDEKFTEGVRRHLGKHALDAELLKLKPEYRGITLKSERKTDVPISRDGNQALHAIGMFLEKTYGLDRKLVENRKRLEARGYLFTDTIRNYTISGQVATLDEVLDAREKGFSVITIDEPIDSHKHGREFQHAVAEIGRQVSLPYRQMHAILRRLTDRDVTYSHKLIALPSREVYAFAINNRDRLRRDIRQAMAEMMEQPMLQANSKTIVDVVIPRACLFTYDGTAKQQRQMRKNVYEGYRSSAEIRSSSEKELERFCEKCQDVDWIYKNGDKGAEYLAIVYEDSFGKQRSFYPDYVVSIRGEIWIMETKGGFSRTGKSNDIDPFTKRKYQVLQAYLGRYHLKGGLVRMDEKSRELCICMGAYSEDINSDAWQLLEEAVR